MVQESGRARAKALTVIHSFDGNARIEAVAKQLAKYKVHLQSDDQ